MVNDPKAIDSDGWALLSRMVTDFPGLHMRLVFLLDRLPSAVEKALDRLGSRLIRWEVEPPTSEEQLALRKAGMAEGLEFQVERVLSRINQTVSQHLGPSLSADDVSISLQVDLDRHLVSRPKPVSARLMICELFLKRKSQPRNEANSVRFF